VSRAPLINGLGTCRANAKAIYLLNGSTAGRASYFRPSGSAGMFHSIQGGYQR